MKMIAALVMAASLVACTDESGSRNALQSSGFSEIQIGGYEWFACSDSDSFHTAFTAKNPAGARVSGVVCCGIAKSCTVRF